MKCQKCRQPIKLHSSLEDLPPAAFNLLTKPAASASSSNPLMSDPGFLQKHVYPLDRRETYLRALEALHTPTGDSDRGERSQLPRPLVKKRVVRAPAPAPSSTRSVYGNPTESFVYLSESQALPPPPQPAAPSRRWGGALAPRSNETEEDDDGPSAMMAAYDEGMEKNSQHIRRTNTLYDLLSARSDIDHPICVECTELLLAELDRRLKMVTRERDRFIDFSKKVHADVPSAEEQEATRKELQALEADEAAAMEELRGLEEEKERVEADIKELEAESRALDDEEETFWRECNAFSRKLTDFQNERDSINLQYDHDSRQLEKLQRTNVYNDTFCIGHDGYFGTINGLRLGRLPHVAVEWTEINAAWGCTLLLLATIADKLGFTFSGYRLRPMGSTSRIEKLDAAGNVASAALELYSSGDLPLGRMFMHRRFDQAMVAFLECLRQMGEWVCEQPIPGTSAPATTTAAAAAATAAAQQDVQMPYPIVKDRIGDSCIRLAFNQDEAWTRACKYTLTCVKWLLAHTRYVNVPTVPVVRAM